CPRHVLRDDRRVAGEVPRQKLGDEPAVDVVAAARTVADQHAQGLAAIEIGNRFGTGLRSPWQDRRRDPERNANPDRRSAHRALGVIAGLVPAISIIFAVIGTAGTKARSRASLTRFARG